MKVKSKVCSAIISPATKNGELKYNDIYVVENDNNDYIHMFINNKKNTVVEMVYNEKLLNELKTATWTVEKNGTTIKSNSFHSYTDKDIRLLNLLKKYKLPRYRIIQQEEVEKNLKLYK